MKSQRSKKASQVFDIIESIADLGIKLGGIAFLLMLSYIIYGLAAKNGFTALAAMPKADRLRVLCLVMITGKIFWVSGAVVAFSVAARYYVEEALGYIISLLGVLLYLGTPYVFATKFPHELLAKNVAIGIVVTNFRSLGMTLFIPGAILILRHFALKIFRLFRRQDIKKARYDSSFIVGEVPDIDPEPYKPRPYSSCWHMPYCRTFIRGFCPAHEAKKSCWRLKRGCMCDGDIIMGALKARSSDGSSFHKELMYRGADMAPKTKLTAAQKRLRCRMCVIYDFHQNQKYKIISPLVFPFVVWLMWSSYSSVVGVLQTAVDFTDKLMKTVAFAPGADGLKHISASATPDYVLVVFVVWLGLIAMSYLLQFVEFCIFGLKI